MRICLATSPDKTLPDVLDFALINIKLYVLLPGVRPRFLLVIQNVRTGWEILLMYKLHHQGNMTLPTLSTSALETNIIPIYRSTPIFAMSGENCSGLYLHRANDRHLREFI